jgi:Fe-S oxidoreductase
MLTPIEKIIFVIAFFASGYTAFLVARRIASIIRRGPGSLSMEHIVRRLVNAAVVFLTQKTVLKRRLLTSIAHLSIVWAFTYFLLANLADVLQGLIPNYVFLGTGPVGNAFRTGADLLGTACLIGVLALMLRRWLIDPKVFSFQSNTLIHPKAATEIRRDSFIVSMFILVHVASHILGDSLLAAQVTYSCGYVANFLCGIWSGVSSSVQVVLEHIFFWSAIGTILGFGPYFLISKHLHIFVAPLNFALKPERRSIGALEKIDMADETLTQFGAAKLEHLSQPQLLDAYACIMCNRCQDACPAHVTGKALSPSALEINKRYHLNAEGAKLAAGQESEVSLLDFAISAEAVWACTACGACIEVCPVNNEPMRDILDIRRDQVMMEAVFPLQLRQAFKGMERQGNPWNTAPESRMDWAQGLNVPTIEQNPEPDVLWWVGCAPATDPRAQKTARDFAKILNAAGVNFAVLGKLERCTGDSARRAGNEAIFFELATSNVETLNEIKPKRIVTTCPHCLHTLKNEYPDYGGNYDVIHHTQLIEELFETGKLKRAPNLAGDVTFHDPCYLGRHNNVYDAPRNALVYAGSAVTEMPRHRNNSFCCGAGGAQMWKEEEHGRERVSANRLREAMATGKDTLAVGCPFCMIMLSDAAQTAASTMQVKDVAEIVAEEISNLKQQISKGDSI